MRTVLFRAALALAATPVAAPAWAQRAASSPSLEDAAGPAAVALPPAGFPMPMGRDIVFGGEVQTHLQADLLSVSRSKTRVSVFNDTDFTGFVNYQHWFSINTEAKLERQRDNNTDSYFTDRHAAFRSEGLTLRQLYATIRPIEGVSVYGGKIHPGFGSAYEKAPGQFYNFGSDYEQDERIGLGVQYELPVHGPELMGLSHVRLTAETFYLDTSSLSRSLFSTPGLADPTASRLRRYTRNQFGPSNTGSFDSATVSLRGGKDSRGLVWQASYTREATAEPGGKTESGWSVGASYDPTGDGIPLTPRLGVMPFLEYAHFSNFGAIPGLNRHYAVGGLAFTYTRWQLSVAAALRNSSGAALGTDHQENITLTYQIVPRFQVGAGFNVINIAGRTSRAVSPALNYVRAF